jgi:hypothetical protein
MTLTKNQRKIHDIIYRIEVMDKKEELTFFDWDLDNEDMKEIARIKGNKYKVVKEYLQNNNIHLDIIGYCNSLKEGNEIIENIIINRLNILS